MKVSNGKCVRHLAWKSLRANRTRNLIAVVAIALTAVLLLVSRPSSKGATVKRKKAKGRGRRQAGRNMQ